MKRGKIVEQGAPWELIKKKGQFRGMVKNTGRNAESICDKARECYEDKIIKGEE